jgi:ABC-type phosphate/phosphonate transport system substrate-binding protein
MVSNGAQGETWRISSSPSFTREQSEKVFIPIAQLLTKATGKDFEYRYPANWPAYIQSMRESKSVLLFDEPHLVSWRIEHGKHIPLLKLSGNKSFVIITRNNDESIVQLSDLAGHPVCANAPPAIDGLVLLAQFNNPVRQPQIRQVKNYTDAYHQLLNGRCRGALLPARLYENISRNGNNTRVLYLSEIFPNLTFSVDSRIPKPLQYQIQQILLSPDRTDTTGAMIDIIDPGTALLPAARSEYQGFSSLLKNFWGLR